MNARVRAWFLLCRPWSLTATFVPFLVVAPVWWALWRASESAAGPAAFGAALAAGLFLQIACNLLNTWGDNRSGVDAVPGAVVTTPQILQGLVTPGQVLAAALGCLVICGGLGVLLCYGVFGDGRFNVPLLVVSALGFLGATNYATGLKFKYHGLGVPFVFILMGPLYFCGLAFALFPFAAVEPGDVWRFVLIVSLVSLPIACLVAAILLGNDMRDRASDRAVGIRTTATVLGPLGSLILYYALHLVPYFHCIGLTALCVANTWFMLFLLLPLAALPLTAATLWKATRVYRANPAAPAWLRLERASGAVHFVFGALYAVALGLSLAFLVV